MTLSKQNEQLLPTSLSAEGDSQQVSLRRKDSGTLLLVQQARANHRPSIHPLVAPDGQGVLTEDVPPHHPWQHGLYVGLNDVNGIGFWTEDNTDGTFHPDSLALPQVVGNTARWSVETVWRAPDTTVMLHETQHWTLTDFGRTHYRLDLRWQLSTAHDTTFGQYPYGGLFLRMPYRAEWGGTVINSHGQHNLEAEGQRAAWCAISMPLADRDEHAGLAILDHPANDGYPTPWRVDHEFGIGPAPCRLGAREQRAGNVIIFHYRLVLFTGTIQEHFIENEWSRFAKEEKA